jgi:hypothetical protein
MATNTDQIVTQLVADTKKFDGAMNGSIQVIKRFNKAGEEIGSRVKVVTKHLEEASSKTNSFRDSMTRLSRDIKVTNTVFDTLAGNITKAYSAASEGSKIMAAEQFFKNAGKSIEEYRKATNGMVSDAELMKKANLADSMGIDEKTFKKLVMVAEASALKTGQSFDYMFNSIIVGTARSSRLLLDNLGIIVSVGQANETYAAKVNKTVEALSAEEKQLAFVEEVARKSQGTLDEYANTTDRTAESFARFDATVTNLVDTMKRLLAVGFSQLLPDLTKAFTDLRVLIEQEDWAATGRYIGARILQGLSAVLSGIDPGSFFDKAEQAFGAQANLTAFEARTNKQAEKNFNLQETYAAKAEIEKMTSESLGSLIRRYQTMKTVGSEALDNLIADLLKFNKAADDVLGLLKDNFWNRPMNEGRPPTGKGKGKGKGKGPDIWKDTKAQLQDLEDDRDSLMSQAGEKVKAAADEANAAWEAFRKKQKELLVASAKADLARIEENAKAAREAREEALRVELEAIKAAAQAWHQFTFDLGGAIGGSLASGGGLFGAVGGVVGPAVGAAIGGPIGGAIGALLPVIGQIIDSLTPVVNLIGAIGDGVALLIGNALTPLLSALEPLAAPLKALLGAMGMLIGMVIHPFAFIVKLVTTTLGGLVGIVAAVVAGVGVFLQAIWAAVQMLFFIFAGHQVGFAFDMFANAVKGATEGIHSFVFGMLEAVATFNNGLVKWIRASIPGMEDFGRLMFAAQFGLLDPIDENTSALDENTQALRDFTREFRNLPQSYKVAGAIYATQNAEMQWQGGRRPRGIGERSVDGFANGRWRT